MRKFNLFIIFASLFFYTGCSGCSNSGIRHQAGKEEIRSQSNYKNTKDENISKSQQSDKNPNSGSLSELFERHRSAVFMVYTSDSEETYQGSGFFIGPNGMAVSNYHVFQGTLKGKEVIVTESGEYRISNVIEHSEDRDYIIFQVKDLAENNYLKVSNSMPEIGEEVWAISNPRGLSHTLSTGIVSGYRDDHYIQTTTEITHGSSGGALLNMNGEVVGITTMGIGEANLNFAVKINELRLHRYLD